MANKTIEEKIQNDFFQVLIEQNKKVKNKNIAIYQYLVYSRYEEVLKNSFPLFVKEISQKELEKHIKSFIQNTPSTELIWQIPKDFISFARKNKIFKNKKYLYELMYFDWIEIELYMKEYKDFIQKSFSFKSTYILSQSARIKRFKYDIIENKFDEKRENFLVIYYDFEKDEVVYREINQIIYEIIRRMKKKQTLKSILENICLENDLDYKEAKEFLEESLKELYFKKVFVQKH